MNNSERGKPMPGLDKKFAFSKLLLWSISIAVGIVLIGTIAGAIFRTPIDFSDVLPWTISIYAMTTAYIKEKQ
jgi:hypothetical protein